jgi:hypothetical protein
LVPPPEARCDQLDGWRRAAEPPLYQGAIDTFNWRAAATVLPAILALVVLGDLASAWLRRRII